MLSNLLLIAVLKCTAHKMWYLVGLLDKGQEGYGSAAWDRGTGHAHVRRSQCISGATDRKRPFRADAARIMDLSSLTPSPSLRLSQIRFWGPSGPAPAMAHTASHCTN